MAIVFYIIGTLSFGCGGLWLYVVFSSPDAVTSADPTIAGYTAIGHWLAAGPGVALVCLSLFCFAIASALSLLGEIAANTKRTEQLISDGLDWWEAEVKEQRQHEGRRR